MAQVFMLLQQWLFCAPSRTCVQLNSVHRVFFSPSLFPTTKYNDINIECYRFCLQYNTILNEMNFFFLKKKKYIECEKVVYLINQKDLRQVVAERSEHRKEQSFPDYHHLLHYHQYSWVVHP